MPSPLNLPLPAYATGGTSAVATEGVIATSAAVNVDTPQYQVVLHWSVDIALGADATAATFKLKRGTTTAGTGITLGETWGPFTVTGNDRVNFSGDGIDSPGAVHGLTYVLTVTLTANDTATTFENVYLEAIVTART